MSRYKEIGFVNTREMLQKALTGGYAVPAYNFVTLEHGEAILRACLETRSPVIIQASRNARRYFSRPVLRHLIRGLMELVVFSPVSIPVAMHLDHGESLEECKAAIEDGYSSVMIDGSALAFRQNIAVTEEVVQYAHRYDVSVEGELGALPGAEEGFTSERGIFTDPDLVEEFADRTGVDSLAVSVGNVHGLTKVVAQQGKWMPELRFDILRKIQDRVPGLPLVLHGSSSVLTEYVAMINRHGGAVKSAIGIPEEQIRKAAQTTVCKINIASDGYLVMTAMIRKTLFEQPGVIDPRQYLGPAREELIRMYRDKNTRLFGCAGRV